VVVEAGESRTPRPILPLGQSCRITMGFLAVEFSEL
jgi:hypothetical protein